jgi:Ykl077w/Psg1 (Pma1 Stabilization in Golgi)
VAVNFQSNNNSAIVAWQSAFFSANRGYTTVTIDKSWLDSGYATNFTLVWTYYSTDISAQKHSAYNITLAPQPVTHYPAPAPTKLPNKESLIIALPIVFGFLLLMTIGLCISMKAHRKIGLSSIMGRKKGYGSGKSRRQRLGIKKGAIRLEEREVLQTRDEAAPRLERTEYRDDHDAITPSAHPWESQRPQQQFLGHNYRASDFSLGSLADEEEPNAFRKEIEQQKTGRF